MTRSELIAALAVRFPRLMDKDAEIAVREILDAVGQYVTDNTSSTSTSTSDGGAVQQKNLIDLVKAAFEAGSVVVNVQNGDPQGIANKIDSERKRKMRRYSLT